MRTVGVSSRRRLVASCGIVALGLWAGPQAAAQGGTTTLKFASFTPATGVINGEAIPDFIREVEAASKGSLKFDFFPGGSLGSSPAAQLKLVEDGVADIAQVVASYTPGRFPDLPVFELPFMAANVTEGSVAAWRMFEKGGLRGFDKVKLLGIVNTGPYGLHGTSPLRGLDDLKAKKIRAGGPIAGGIVRSLGAVPVGNIAAPSIGEAISRGVIDATLISYANLHSFGVTEVVMHHLDGLALGSVPIFYAMNKKKYESLSADQKAALDKYAGEWFSRRLAKALDDSETLNRTKLRADPKHHFYELTPEETSRFQKALEGLKEGWDKPNPNGMNLYQAYQAELRQVRAAAR